MKKKLIFMAVATALSTPAFADNANVTVYGKAFMTFDQKSSDAAGSVNIMRVNTNASRFGIKGSEDLGEGMKAVYQFEVQMDADGNGGNGLGNGSRNSGAGVEGDFGKVMFGIWDTPFKAAHNKIELFDNTTNWSSTKVIGQTKGLDYNTRQKNMVQYWSPKLGELVSLSALYAPDEARTAATPTTPATNKTVMSVAATVELDDIYAAVAYESRPDQSIAGTTDSAIRLVGSYTYDMFTLGGLYETFKTNTGATTSIKSRNGEVVAKVKFDSSALALSYAKAGSTAAAGTVANSITQSTLKYSNNYSKRTEMFVAYSRNKAKATNVTTNYVGMGIVHSF